MFYGLDEHTAEFLVNTQPFNIAGIPNLSADATGFSVAVEGSRSIGVVLDFPISAYNLYSRTYNIQEFSWNSGKCYIVKINPRNRGLNLLIAHSAEYKPVGRVKSSCGFVRNPKDLWVARLSCCTVSKGMPIEPRYLEYKSGILMGWRGAMLYNITFSEMMTVKRLCNPLLLSGGCTVRSDEKCKSDYSGLYIDIRNFLITPK